MDSKDLVYMKMAVKMARKSRSEPRGVHPYVGAVVVKDGRVLAKTFRGQKKLGEHAEYAAIERRLASRNLVGATVFTTLEPCTTRNHPKVPCAKRLIERRVSKVIIGMLDPNQNICGRGVRLLRDAGITVEFFPKDLMAEVEAQNRDFTRDQARAESELIPCGLGQTGSPYDFHYFVDEQTREVILVAQNLRTLLSRSEFLPHVRRLLSRGTNVTVVLTTFEMMTAHSAAAAMHLTASVKQLRDFCHSLKSKKQRRLLEIKFHSGATSLSTQVRDPSDINRAVLVFTPKWATDTEPENRIYCVLKRREHKSLFDKLYGAIPGMVQADSLDLRQMCSHLQIQWHPRQTRKDSQVRRSIRR